VLIQMQERIREIRERQAAVVEKYGIVVDAAAQPLSDRLRDAGDVKRCESLSSREYLQAFRSTPLICDASSVCDSDADGLMEALRTGYGDLQINQLDVSYGSTLRIAKLAWFPPEDVLALQSMASELTVREFLDEAESGLIMYLSNLSIPENFPRLLDFYRMPSLVGRNLLRPWSGRGCDQELFVGPAGTGFGRLHQDARGPLVCFLQLQGEKEFVLFPPEDRYALGAYRQAPRQAEMFSQFDPFSERNSPGFDNADLHPYRAVLRAGEVLIMPPSWFHTSRNLTLSVTVAERLWTPRNARYLLRHYLMKAFSLCFPFLRGYP
tara:strand:- start:2932 stop:3900 length:969 start_codon:yes stop_codon:yes gene_type:complete